MSAGNNKKRIWAWAFYDFANSAFTTLIITFIYSTFFISKIASDEIAGTGLWSRAITLSALLIAVLSPIMGAASDVGGYRQKMLIFWSMISIGATMMLYFALPGEIYFALGWVVIANVAFEMGIVFYNSFLPDISTKENVGRISGFGWGMGYVGGLIALFIAFGFVFPSDAPLFGVSQENSQNIRATALLVAGWFFVFALPALFILKDTIPTRKKAFGEVMNSSLKQIKGTFQEIKKYRQIVRLLVARLLYNDGLLTIFAFGGIYAAGTFKFTPEEIILFGIVLNVMAGAGAFVFGFADDKMGGKNTVQISNIGLCIATIIAVLAPTKAVFWVAGILVGIFSGPNQSASRSLLARFVPKEKDAEFFGFFAFSGKATAFLGPLLLGIFTEAFANQRAGVAIIILFFIFGGLLMLRVDENEGINIAKEQRLE